MPRPHLRFKDLYGTTCLIESPPSPVSPAPSVSGPSPTYVGNTLSTSAGGWSSCYAITAYHYRWLRNGVAIPAATSSSYAVATADVDMTLRSQVEACNAYGCSGYVSSSNSLTIVNRYPNMPSSLSPAAGALVSTSVNLSSVYSDPDGQAGHVSYSVYNYSTGAPVTSGSGPTVASGSVSAWTTPALAGNTWYQWVAQAADASNTSSSVTPWRTFYANIAPPVPALNSPANLERLPTTPVVLSASSSDPDGVNYQFQIGADSGFAAVVADSGWLPSTSTWTAPPGVLKDGSTSYYWRVRAKDGYGATSAWSGSRSFDIRLPKLGARDYWPIWTHGPLAVNQANGNLIA